MKDDSKEPEWMQWLTVFLIIDAIAGGLFLLFLLGLYLVAR